MGSHKEEEKTPRKKKRTPVNKVTYFCEGKDKAALLGHSKEKEKKKERDRKGGQRMR